jgi:triacylglycerol esterase/lipase EstA (alpha/beta hydrolase family)
MRRIASRSTALLMAVIGLVVLASPAAASTPSPPGANDWNCKPSGERPRPVVLVHGTFGNMADNWLVTSPALKAAGYCVFALNYGGYGLGPSLGIYGTGPIADSARELDRFVARVRAATGAAKVSLVGHSQGGMMPRYYLKYLGGKHEVDDLIGLAPSNHGTTNPLAPPGGLLCPACAEQAAGSAFLRNLNAGDETPGNVSYTVVVTRYDAVVVPYTSGYLAPGPNTTNALLQERCPLNFADHLAISNDPAAIQWVEHALRRPGPADPRFQPNCL